MIEKISYRGWPNAYRLSNGIVELTVLADVGPRVISYKFIGDENQFYEIDDQAGLTGGAQFRLYGGHRLWVSPEGPSTYYPDNQASTVSQNADSHFKTDRGGCRKGSHQTGWRIERRHGAESRY